MTDADRLRLRIPARPEYLVLGRLALAGIARIRPIDPDDLSDLKLALTEACTNSMRHAYGAGGGAVEIDIELTDDSIAIEVRDDGPGFERGRRATLDGELDEGGLGLAIVEAIVDELDIGRGPDGAGSRVRFRRNLTTVTTDETRSG